MHRARPHFLHIGPEKTGTSWLYAVLSRHDDVSLPPVKEIRYFYERCAYPHEGLVDRFRKGDWHNQDYRRYASERLLDALRHPLATLRSLDHLKWDIRFLTGRRSDTWFEALFDASGGKLTGDFSPQTFHLPSHEIVRIAREWPKLKVTLMLREPVDWTWSFARMTLIGDRDLEQIPDEEILTFFREYAGYYPSLSRIRVWEAEFGDRLGVFFFDDLDDPVCLLSQVCGFLKLPDLPLLDLPEKSKKRNAGRELAIPPRFKRYLIDLFEAEVRHLAHRYGKYPRQWLESYAS